MRLRLAHCRALFPAATRRGGGFTLVEMLLGLVLTAMIALTIAGLASVSSSVWRAQVNAVGADVDQERVGGYLDDLLRNSRDVLYASDPSPLGRQVLVVWRGDAYDQNGVVANDDAAQWAELALLVADPAAGRLEVYLPAAPDTAQPGAAAAPATIFPARGSDPAAELSPESLDAGDAIPAYFTATPLLGDSSTKVRVTEAAFAVDRAGRLPLVRYTIALDAAGRAARLAGVARLRLAPVAVAPAVAPDRSVGGTLNAQGL